MKRISTPNIGSSSGTIRSDQLILVPAGCSVQGGDFYSDHIGEFSSDHDIIPFSSAGAQLLFQFCSALHEQVALIVTTNLAFSDWPQVFGDARLTAALIDRLTYHAHIFEFRGQSYRFLNHAQEVPTEPTMTT
jgi:hypothetical protein